MREANVPEPERRAGFSLVEVLVVAVLGVLVLAVVARTVTIQGQGFQYQSSVAQSQSRARVAVQVLANELREVSATDGDLLDAQAMSITVRSLRKIGVICYDDNAGSGTIDVWALGGSFAVNDSVWVFLNHDPTLVSDDEWVAGTVSAVGSNVDAGSCTDWPRYSLTGTELTDPYPTQRVTVAGPSLSGALTGGLVRSFLHVTYGLETTDGVTALVREEGDQSVRLVEHLAAPSDSGLVFAYTDTAGTALSASAAQADPGSIGRIGITVRAREDGPALAGASSGYHEDVLTTSITLRNNLVDQIFDADAFTTGGGG